MSPTSHLRPHRTWCIPRLGAQCSLIGLQTWDSSRLRSAVWVFPKVQRLKCGSARIAVYIYPSTFWPFSFALESLNKMNMTEIKWHGCSPALLETVMQAIMILQGKEPTWVEAKSQLWERQLQRRMKGWIRKGNWKEVCSETKPFGLDREEIGSVAKKHRENGRTKVPKKWAK